jgi:hypothetical protein
MSCDILRNAYLEPSFVVYYPDIVYTNPRIAEIDILLLLNGGYICIELKKDPQESPKDSLKFFSDGLGSQAVLYISSKPLGPEVISGVGILNPLIISRDNFAFEKLKKWREYLTKFCAERHKFFSIDNFLCTLILYGSPEICNLLLSEKGDSDSIVPFDRPRELNDLIRHRISLIKCVKGLTAHPPSENYIDKIVENDKIESAKGGKLVVLIPLISPSLLNKAAESIKNLREFAEIVLLCTDKSFDNCKMMERELMKKGLENLETDSVKIEEWSSRAVEEASGGGTILLVGEIPKNVLIELVNKIHEKGGGSIELASLLWRPVLKSEFKEELEKVIEGKECDFGLREDVKLVSVRL